MRRITGAALVATCFACAPVAAAAQRTAAQADTTVAMDPGATLDARLENGTIRVTGWDRDEMRASVRPGRDVALSITRGEGAIRLRLRGLDDELDDLDVELEIRIPRSAGLRVHGPDVDIRVQDVDGRIEAESQDGDVFISGGRGERLVSARSGDGDLELRDVRGRVEAFTIDGDVRLDGVEGDVEAESVDGDLILRNVSSPHVIARTTDGDAEFEGELRPGGRYRISTHDGDVRFLFAGNAGADLEVTVYGGDLVTDLPVRLESGLRSATREDADAPALRRYTITVGGGGASVSLESFDGTVRVRRAGDVAGG